MKVPLLQALVLLLLSFQIVSAQTLDEIKGGWQGPDGVYIFADGFYAYAAYDENEFEGTHGGKFDLAGGKMNRQFEFNTFDPEKVGSSVSETLSISGSKLLINGQSFDRIDDGSPGKLAGAWLFSGRKQQDGTISRRQEGPRKTMKILSGQRFQWIAYNTDTRQFMGTGGGTYTTEDGKYIEKIDFFSRDQTRVGASLTFDYDLQGDDWHHQGKSSRGEPLYEVWSKRK